MPNVFAGKRGLKGTAQHILAATCSIVNTRGAIIYHSLLAPLLGPNVCEELPVHGWDPRAVFPYVGGRAAVTHLDKLLATAHNAPPLLLLHELDLLFSLGDKLLLP